eukprot:COSAG05_NODE_17636_length_322_cov_0.681614_2_plen_20_part_01
MHAVGKMEMDKIILQKGATA